ncbi:hypothetical protein AB0C02_28155 [Micromonospora sp. NPDC048999]|uniref:hypothetical protein n=1 Tax=Micromonospora sp. NPDC048999 TaxID=3155391 RepID=UPI0033EDBC36
MFLAWSKDDRDKAIWQYAREQSRCRGCGTRSDEWSPDAGGDRNAYLAVVDRCRGCEVKQAEQDRIKDKRLGFGAFVRLRRRG